MSTEKTMTKELLRGGQFLVKETACEDIFTPEDFSEEQRMMKEAVMEFNERDIIAHRDRFEKKDYALTEEVMRKAGELGFLGVAVPEEYGGLGMGFVSTLLTCDYISSGTGSFSTAFALIQELEPCQLPFMEQMSKNKNTFLN
jgi:alkylation response protein AidB-like acyl-CoA dehydrogenase